MSKLKGLEFKNCENINVITGKIFRIGKSAKESNFGELIVTSFNKESVSDLFEINVEIR